MVRITSVIAVMPNKVYKLFVNVCTSNHIFLYTYQYVVHVLIICSYIMYVNSYTYVRLLYGSGYFNFAAKVPSQSCSCAFLVLISIHFLSFFGKYFFLFLYMYQYVVHVLIICSNYYYIIYVFTVP